MEFCSKPETCPKCGSIFVDWDRYQKVYRCLVKSCGWTSKYKNKNGLSSGYYETPPLKHLQNAK
jgi:hypothetical protein